MRPMRVASLVFLEVLAAGSLAAQTAKPPDTYTVTQAGSMMAPTATTIIYRDGSKALVDLSNPPSSHSRTLYDLQAGKSISWNVADPSACSAGSFSGDWGDPFANSAELTAQVASGQVKEVGSETVNGMTAKMLEAGGGKIKAWMDSKNGLILKLQMEGPDGKKQTMLEVKQVSFTAPPASTFALPAACRNMPAPPPTASQRIAAATGGKAENYASAIMGPGSANSCTVLVKFVRAGSMQPITRRISIRTGPDLRYRTSSQLQHGSGGRRPLDVWRGRHPRIDGRIPKWGPAHRESTKAVLPRRGFW